MTIRSEFEQIIKEYGHNVYLQRSKVEEDGEITYSDKLEKHTTRFSVGVHRNLPRSQEEAMEGILNSTDRTYYFAAGVKPFEGDRVYDYLDRAPEDQEVWLINATVGLRGEDGRICFWAAGVSRIHPS